MQQKKGAVRDCVDMWTWHRNYSPTQTLDCRFYPGRCGEGIAGGRGRNAVIRSHSDGFPTIRRVRQNSRVH